MFTVHQIGMQEGALVLRTRAFELTTSARSDGRVAREPGMLPVNWFTLKSTEVRAVKDENTSGSCPRSPREDKVTAVTRSGLTPHVNPGHLVAGGTHGSTEAFP